MSDHHAGRVCPGCHHSKADPLFVGSGFDNPAEQFQLVCCANCELTRIEPTLPTETLASYYSASYYGHQSQQKFALPIELLVRTANNKRANELIKLLPEITAETKILDIGCGRGHFIRTLHRKGFDCYGTELATYPLPASEPRLTFNNGELGKLSLPLQSFSAISIWHVLEHTSEPGIVIKQVADLLKPAGVLALAVPNFGSTQRKLFGKHWFHLDLPRHLYHFNEKSLLSLLSKHGLQVISIRTNSLDQNLFGFIQSAINCVLPNKANLLFSLLKRKMNTADSKLSTIVYGGMSLVLATCLLPISLLENIISTWRGQGGTLIIYARKS